MDFFSSFLFATVLVGFIALEGNDSRAFQINYTVQQFKYTRRTLYLY